MQSKVNGRFLRVYPVTIKSCKQCTAKFKARRRESRKGKIYWSLFCSQKCSHKFQVGDKAGSWKRGYYKCSNGYLANGVTTRYLHREVYEKFHGIKLRTEDVIHHINGIKTDNRIENLQLTNQSDHMKEHYKTRALRKLHGERVHRGRRLAKMMAG